MIYDRQKLEELRDKYEKDYTWYVLCEKDEYPLCRRIGFTGGLQVIQGI